METKRNALNELNLTKEEIEKKLNEIKKALIESNKVDSKVNWGDVAEANKVLEDLRYITEFLGLGK